jgi:hypothetical protein
MKTATKVRKPEELSYFSVLVFALHWLSLPGRDIDGQKERVQENQPSQSEKVTYFVACQE